MQDLTVCRLVVLCRGHTGRVLKGIEAILGGLDLRLNEDKTREIDEKKQSFKFLGLTVEVKKNPKTGKLFPLITPSKEAMVEIKAEIKAGELPFVLRYLLFFIPYSEFNTEWAHSKEFTLRDFK